VKVRKGRILLVLATAISAGGCAATRRHEASLTGDLLVAAGFKPKLPTRRRLALLAVTNEGSYDMTLDLITRAAALIAVLGTAVVYGTDVFCAIVLRPALALVDDRALVAVMRSVHRYGDRRMPVPAMLGVPATATSAVLATVAAHWAQAIAAGAALVLLLVWIVLYTQVSAPINRQLTAVADASQPLPNGRVLQAKWDRIIGARAMLQGLALAALCVALTI
jgi:hypothetical protein